MFYIGDFKRFAELFTPDATIDIVKPGIVKHGTDEIEGWQQSDKFYTYLLLMKIIYVTPVGLRIIFCICGKRD